MENAREGVVVQSVLYMCGVLGCSGHVEEKEGKN